MRNILIFAFVSMFIVGCGQAVEIPPAHVGKILTQNGFNPDVLSPSKFRLDACTVYCDRLIVLEAGDTPLIEEMEVFMPQDKLNIAVEIRGTFSIPSDKTVLNSIFDRVPAGNGGYIDSNTIYSTYGQQAVRGIVRSEIVKYSIADVLERRDVIGQNIHAAIVDKLKTTNTPVSISRFELANVQPPKVIVAAQEATKKREVDILQAEADAQVAIRVAEKDLEIAQKNRLVEREKALAIAEQNDIAAKSITPQLLEYRRLEVSERIYQNLASSQNAGLIVVPADTSFSEIQSGAVFGKTLARQLPALTGTQP